MAAKKKPTRKKTVKKSTAKRPPTGKRSVSKSKAKASTKRGASRRSPVSRQGGRAAGEDGRVAEIKRIIDVMVAAGAVEVEMKDGDSRLRVRLKEDHPAPVVSYAAPPVAPAPGIAAAPTAAAPVEDDPSRYVFTSPMVGTFYRAASPESEVFAKVGDSVTDDSTMCILEAMKVMNEIKAECSGVILEILTQNGEPVEFGQPLFVIKVD